MLFGIPLRVDFLHSRGGRPGGRLPSNRPALSSSRHWDLVGNITVDFALFFFNQRRDGSWRSGRGQRFTFGQTFRRSNCGLVVIRLFSSLHDFLFKSGVSPFRRRPLCAQWILVFYNASSALFLS